VSRTPALAVVACDGQGHGCIVWNLGMQEVLEEAGLHDLSDMGLDDALRGVGVWEGLLVWTHCPPVYDGPAEDDFELVGEHREPTSEEWEAIRAGKNPFEHRRCQYAHYDGEGEEEQIVTCDDVAVDGGLCGGHRLLNLVGPGPLKFD